MMYHQIMMHDGISLSRLNSFEGQYKYNMMPFSLTNTLDSFQHLMNQN